MRLRNLAAKNADEISFLEALKRDVEADGLIDGPVTRRIADRITWLQSGIVAVDAERDGGRESSLLSGHESTPDDAPTSRRSSDGVAGHVAQTVSTDVREADASILTALEYLAWGRSSGGCYPHISCACRLNGSLTDTQGVVKTVGLLGTFASALPSPSDARRLVEFHLRHIAWHHNCLHGPTFLRQCEAFWADGRYDHPLWGALYLSVLSVNIDMSSSISQYLIHRRRARCTVSRIVASIVHS